MSCADDFVPGFFVHVVAGEDGFVAFTEELGELAVAFSFDTERVGIGVNDSENLVSGSFEEDEIFVRLGVDGVFAEVGDKFVGLLLVHLSPFR